MNGKLAQHVLNQQLPSGWHVLSVDGEMFLRPEDGDYYEARLVRLVDGEKQYVSVRLSTHFPKMGSCDMLSAFKAAAAEAVRAA